MDKDKNYWHTNKEIPENGSCVLWKAKLFSKERGNIEGGRYDQYYDCFCGSASLFVNRSSIKQWIYCKDIFDILDQNTRLQKQLDREIHINRKMKKCLSAFARRDNWKAIEGCADWLFLLDPLMAEETLKEIDNKE